MMLDLKADGRAKLMLGEQIVMIESLRDQVEDLTKKVAELESRLATKPTAVKQD